MWPATVTVEREKEEAEHVERCHKCGKKSHDKDEITTTFRTVSEPQNFVFREETGKNRQS